MNDTLFSVTSYNGVTVTCSKENWDNHITDHHEELIGAERAVKDTIKDPDSVYKSKHGDGSEVFFKNSSYSTRKVPMSVVVSYGPGKKNPNTLVGEVVTAFYQKNVGGDGDAIYTRQS